MEAQYQHALLSRPTADERGREHFIAAMRRFLITDAYAGNETAYRARQVPDFIRAHGRPPASYLEVKQAMAGDPYYRGFSLLNRATQELLWDTVAESIERQMPALMETARSLPAAGGSLTIDPDFELPAYARKVDIHVMPGSFHTALGADDCFAGAVYDRGVYLYAYGGLGADNAALGQGTVDVIRERFPRFVPSRILDMGCGAGMSTHPLAAAWPAAEIQAIDIAAPMLRYAHARSEAMQVPIQYSQQNAGRTNFADGSFDLVVSNLLLHEIPQSLTRQIIKECHRLLRPGGVMIHNDLVGWPTDPFQQFMAEWNAHHNNEPFERGSGTIDWHAACTAAGFGADDIFRQPVVAAYMSEQLGHVGYRGAVRR